MIENGNDFTYTEMIKALLKISKGDSFVYDYRKHRGFYSDNFYIRYTDPQKTKFNGYMVNGRGTCGVYKNENNRWSAKYY